MRNHDTIVALALLGIVGFFYSETLDMPSKATWFPRTVLVVLAVLGLALLWTSTRRSSGPVAQKGGRTASRANRAVLLALIIFGYVFALDKLGYIISTAAFLVAAMGLLGVRNRWLMLGLAVVMSVGISYLFSSVFRVMMPRSALLTW